MGENNKMQSAEDFLVEVPWGHVAGKSWGDPNKEIVLVFHGLQDNAGSFDGLIKYFPNTYCYKVFDLPGHGKSSHFPHGILYHTHNNILVYRIIAEYFKQTSYTIIGHSYGGQIGIAFAQLYPQFVKKIVLLDTVTLYPTLRSNYKNYFVSRHDKHLQLMEKYKTHKQPIYSYEEAMTRLKDGRAYGDVTEEAAKNLFERATVKTEDGRYKFTNDQRLKMFFNPDHDMRQLIGLLRQYPITCPILFVISSESHYQYDFFKPVIKEFKKNKYVAVKYVNGNHNVHMNSPEIVGPIVHDFLIKYKNYKINKNKL